MIFFKKIKLLFFFQYLIILFLPLFLVLGNLATNIALTLFVILFIYLTFLEKDFHIYKNVYIKILLFFWLYLILNSIFINYSEIAIFKAIAFVRFLILPFALIYFFKNKIFSKKIIFYFYSIFFSFISIDLIFQYLSGKNILGLSPQICNSSKFISYELICERYSGMFGNELIAGSFLLLFALPSLIFLMRMGNDIKYSKFLFFLILPLILIASFITGDRTPVLIFVLACFIFFLFLKINLIKKITFSLILFSLFFLTIYFIPHLKHRFINWPIQQMSSNLDNKNFMQSLSENFLFNSQWGLQYLNAFEIFRNNMLFGKGIKSFRYECKMYDNKYLRSKYKITELKENAQRFKGPEPTSGCSTHPHHIYLELLAETGIIGLLIFIFFLTILITKIFHKNKSDYVFFGIFSLMLALIFPFKPTGSFFSTWNAYILWIQLSFCMYWSDIKVIKKIV